MPDAMSIANATEVWRIFLGIFAVRRLGVRRGCVRIPNSKFQILNWRGRASGRSAQARFRF
jgi:hypothetical protein